MTLFNLNFNDWLKKGGINQEELDEEELQKLWEEFWAKEDAKLLEKWNEVRGIYPEVGNEPKIPVFPLLPLKEEPDYDLDPKIINKWNEYAGDYPQTPAKKPQVVFPIIKEEAEQAKKQKELEAEKTRIRQEALQEEAESYLNTYLQQKKLKAAGEKANPFSVLGQLANEDIPEQEEAEAKPKANLSMQEFNDKLAAARKSANPWSAYGQLLEEIMPGEKQAEKPKTRLSNQELQDKLAAARKSANPWSAYGQLLEEIRPGKKPQPATVFNIIKEEEESSETQVPPNYLAATGNISDFIGVKEGKDRNLEELIGEKTAGEVEIQKGSSQKINYQDPLKPVNQNWGGINFYNQHLEDIVPEISLEYQIPQEVLAAIAHQENGTTAKQMLNQGKDFLEKSRRRDVSLGICQMSISTAMFLDGILRINDKLEWPELTATEREKLLQDCLKRNPEDYDYYAAILTDPEENLKYAARYLNWLKDLRYGEKPAIQDNSWKTIMKMYNAGYAPGEEEKEENEEEDEKSYAEQAYKSMKYFKAYFNYNVK